MSIGKKYTILSLLRLIASNHVGNLQVFDKDDLSFVNQLLSGFKMPLLALPSDALMQFSNTLIQFAPSPRPLSLEFFEEG